MCRHTRREEDSRPEQSTVVRPLHFLQELCDAVDAEPRFQAERKRRHLEWLARFRLAGSGHSEPQQPVDRPLEGVARPPHLVIHEVGDIVVDGKSSPHIMMLCDKTS